jgi:hypothetical protein
MERTDVDAAAALTSGRLYETAPPFAAAARSLFDV